MAKKVYLIYEGITRGAEIGTERSIMNDVKIIEYLFERREEGIEKIAELYSGLYKSILRQILANESDVAECANDVLLAVWNSIPPNRPRNLQSYICQIARNIGINKYKHLTREKRNNAYTIMLSELEESLPSNDREVDETSERISAVLSDFLRELKPDVRVLFIRRYIYFESVASLAVRFGVNENAISAKLFRARVKLRKKLEKEGL